MVNSHYLVSVLQTPPRVLVGSRYGYSTGKGTGNEACDNHEREAKHRVLGEMPQCGSGTDLPWSPGLSSRRFTLYRDPALKSTPHPHSLCHQMCG